MEEIYLFENNLQYRFEIEFTLRNLTHTYCSYGAGEGNRTLFTLKTTMNNGLKQSKFHCLSLFSMSLTQFQRMGE